MVVPVTPSVGVTFPAVALPKFRSLRWTITPIEWRDGDGMFWALEWSMAGISKGGYCGPQTVTGVARSRGVIFSLFHRTQSFPGTTRFGVPDHLDASAGGEGDTSAVVINYPWEIGETLHMEVQFVGLGQVGARDVGDRSGGLMQASVNGWSVGTLAVPSPSWGLFNNLVGTWAERYSGVQPATCAELPFSRGRFADLEAEDINGVVYVPDTAVDNTNHAQAASDPNICDSYVEFVEPGAWEVRNGGSTS